MPGSNWPSGRKALRAMGLPPIVPRLCERWGITIEEIPEGVYRDHVSYCAGGDEIFLGDYDDPELLLLSFFHELGHCANTQDQTLPPFDEWPHPEHHESMAWQRGLDLADEEGIAFSDEALRWAAEQLATHFSDDNPEKAPTRYLPVALAEAHLEGFLVRERGTAVEKTEDP